ncbi:MAG: chorismate mutase, partial [Pseudomonadota bacterium]
WRIQEVVDRVRARAEERNLPPELAEALWRQMIGWFVQYEEEQIACGAGAPTQPGGGTAASNAAASEGTKS